MDKRIVLSDEQLNIYFIHDVKVMLDRDLAKLYGVETGQLNRQVRRNRERFPEDFMFQLTKEEMQSLMCQNGISKRGGTRKLPFAFTELGVSMLSSVLNSKRAIQANIYIMRAFVRLREMLPTNKPIAKRVEELEKTVSRHDDNMKAIFTSLRYITMHLPPKRS